MLSVDGIKKLKPEEIKKSRQIVLDYISEKENEISKAPIEKTIGRKMVDGLMSLKKLKKHEQENSVEKQKEINEINMRKEEAIRKKMEESAKAKEEQKIIEEKKSQEIRKNELEREKNARIEEEKRKKTEEEERKKMEKEKIKQEQIKRKEKEKEEKRRIEEQERKRYEQAERKRIIEEEKAKAEKIKIEEEREKAKRLENEKKKLEKIKQGIEKKKEKERLKQERAVLSEERKRKNKIKRAKMIKKFKKGFAKFRLNVLNFFRHHIAITFILCAVLLLLIYVGFLAVILRTDSKYAGTIAKFMHAPAVITTKGIISYEHLSSYLNMAQEYPTIDPAQSRKTIGKILLSEIVLHKLSDKYGVRFNQIDFYDRFKNNIIEINNRPELNSFIPQDLREKLNKNIIVDGDINALGLAKVRHIEKVLKTKTDLSEVKNLADEFSSSYINLSVAKIKFGEDIGSLKIGEISSLKINDNGYYFVQKFGVSGNLVGLNYIFIKAVSLDDYLESELGKLKSFSLIN